MSNKDKKELFDIKSKIFYDKISALSTAEEKGIIQAKLEIAKNLLDILDDEIIAFKTDLAVDDKRNLDN